MPILVRTMQLAHKSKAVNKGEREGKKEGGLFMMLGPQCLGKNKNELGLW